jgi:hypothetical protein
LPHSDPLVLTTPQLLAQTNLTSQQYETLAQSGVYILIHLLR